jgi:CHAD domain-containing protein
VIRDAVFFSKESGNLLKLLENAAVDGHEKEVSQGLKYLNSLIHTDTAKSANSIESLYGALPEGTKIEDLSLPLPKTPEEVSQLLEDAQKRYVERVNLDKVEGLLKKLKDGKSLDGDEIKYLKDARKSSLNLRSAILTLGTKNAKEAFESVRNYVTQLGNVNDRLGKLDDDDDVPKALQEQAEDTLDIYKKIKRKNLLNAKIPARSPEELQQVNAEFLKQLKGILARNKSLLALGKDTLRKILKGKKAVDPSMRITIGEYHDVRKMLRDLMGVLQLITERNPSPEANAALNFVNQVQKKMGKMKDGFEIPVDEKAAVKFDMHPTLIDASTQKDLESIEKMMENLKDTSKIGAGAAVSGANCAKHFSGLK